MSKFSVYIIQQIAIKRTTDRNIKTNPGLSFPIIFVAGLLENCCNSVVAQPQVPDLTLQNPFQIFLLLPNNQPHFPDEENTDA
ncbi:hypothetical protein NIES2100_63390 [Calothrix sp. NIES-2100]|uniref:hypothetical protein n=1 Tax=Calothrix sp. NIES-2100 TaxID=1954172 RepID=UPI000B617DF8|nr:hypothetical protein NIES2100_63390 [Calothrix sp. NIES-2100]